MTRFFSSVLGLLILATVSAAEETGDDFVPRTFLLSTEKLDEARTAVRSGDRDSLDRFKTLKRHASRALEMQRLPSVTNNDYVAPGASKNDYVSFSTYYWPDPSKPDGLPYIRRDGEANTERLRVENGHDLPYLTEMVDSVKTLTLAWYLSGDPVCARQAIRILRHWFLDPATRMNPDLQYSQAVCGRDTGTATGIIDTYRFADMMDMLGLLESCPDWTAGDRAGMKRWFEEFLDWLRNSKFGKRESVAKNNHGSWYDVQLIAYSLYVGQTALARETLERSKSRIDSQIEKDGRQPEELRRTIPFTYCIMNLYPLIRLARYSELLDVDLWNYTGSRGGSIRNAYAFLLPFAEEKKPWPYPDLHFSPASFDNVRILSSGRFDNDSEKSKSLTKRYQFETFLR